MLFWDTFIAERNLSQNPMTCARQFHMANLLLKLHWCSQQCSNPRQQSSRGTAVEHTMIEAEGEICFHHGHELSFACIPAWHLASSSHAQHNRLLRQWNRRGPGQS